MMNSREVQSLYDDLPALIWAGVLTQDDATRLREHYGEVTSASKATVFAMLIAVLGAGLIGSGVILLIAHNWEQLGRPARTVLSFAPLFAGQLIGFWVLAKRSHSPAWCEGVTLLLIAGIGAAISLIAQTYHITGDQATFFLTWSLLVLPCIYLFKSTTGSLFYLCGILLWAGFAQERFGQPQLFWPLTALLFPFLWWQSKERLEDMRAAWLSLALALHFTIGLGIILQDSMTALWTIVFAALMTIYILVGERLPSRTTRVPFLLVGGIGAPILMLVFTFEGIWRNAGYRGDDITKAPLLPDLVLLGILAIVIGLTIFGPKQKRAVSFLWVAFPVLTVIAFALAAWGVPAGIAQAMFNLYTAVVGIAMLVAGVRRGSMVLANYGMVIVSALAILRFFDADISFVLRGIIFIVVGICFLATNLVLVRKRTANGGAA